MLLVSLILAGCTGDGGVPTPVATATETPSPPQGTVAPPSEDEVFTADEAILDVAITEPQTLDPMRIQDPGSVLVARQLFESLTAWDPVGQAVIPAAAESWDVKQGGRRFRFNLRQGMTFHDGSPVRAKDFVYALNRIAQKKSASELAYTLERIQGFEAVNQLGNGNRMIGLQAPDDLTLVITLSEPFRDLPAVLTHPGLVPLKPRFVRRIDSFLSQPVGNGPFQIADPWVPEEPVLLRSFRGFYQPALIDGLRMTPFSDAAESWLRFVGGEFHAAEVPAGRIETAAENFGTLGFKPFLAGSYYGLNLRSKQLKSKKLRRAISIGIDRQSIATAIYKDTVQPPRGIVPTGMPGFEEDVCGNLCDFDPERSAKLVSELPRSRRTVTLDYTRGEPHRSVARAMKETLAEAGLEVKLKAYGFRRYLKRLRDGKQAMYRLGWIAEYPVADVFLSALFGSDSPDNHSGFRSKKVDRVLRRAHRAAGQEERLRLYRRAERLILEDIPIVPIGTFVTHWAVQNDVQGINFDVMGGFDAITVSLTE